MEERSCWGISGCEKAELNRRSRAQQDPYLNRLFKNTAIGRETSTLMLTVTRESSFKKKKKEDGYQP